MSPGSIWPVSEPDAERAHGQAEPPPPPQPGPPQPGFPQPHFPPPGAAHPGFPQPGAGLPPYAPAGGWFADSRVLPDRSEIVSALLVAMALAALGAAAGLLWQWLTPGAEVLMTRDGPMHADPHAETYFGDDAVFALLGLALGVLAALGCWFLARRHRGPAQLVGMVTGCLLGAVVAWQVGRQIGLADFYQSIEQAEPGETFRRPAKLAAHGVLGLQGFASVFTYTLLAGWSRWPGLRRPE
ncbi:MAG: DUF2567 domain-containing protein [Micromonosporaceae bacterium]|nr:DUF2567 domain-containing protein [Micromonosporaceae bacterium]